MFLLHGLANRDLFFNDIPLFQLFTKPHPSRNAQGKSSSGRETGLFLHSSGILPPFVSSLQNLKLSPITIKGAAGAVFHFLSQHTHNSWIGWIWVFKSTKVVPQLCMSWFNHDPFCQLWFMYLCIRSRHWKLLQTCRVWNKFFFFIRHHPVCMDLCGPLERSISTIVWGISVSQWISVCGPGHRTEPRCETCQPYHTSCARRKVNKSALNPTELNIFSILPDYPKGAIGHIVHTEKGILAVEKNKILIPPLWNKTFSWGFEDFTCCFGNYGSEKVNKKNSKNSRN